MSYDDDDDPSMEHWNSVDILLLETVQYNFNQC